MIELIDNTEKTWESDAKREITIGERQVATRTSWQCHGHTFTGSRGCHPGQRKHDNTGGGVALLTPVLLKDHIAWIQLARGFFGAAHSGLADALVLRYTGATKEWHDQNAADQRDYAGCSRHHEETSLNL